MNATPMNLSAGQAVQAQSTAGKPQDSAAPDTPFSQVLSSEIAQNRSRSEARQDTDTQASKDAAPQTDRPAEDAALAAEKTEKAAPEESTAFDPLAPLAAGAATAPEALIALALNPDALKPAPARTDGVDTEQAAGLAAHALPIQGSRKGPAPLTTQAGQADNTNPGRPGTTGLQQAALQTAATAATAAPASAFSGQLAAALQADTMKMGEFVSDLMSNPAMRPASHPLETLNTLSEAAAPRLAPAVGTPAWGQALGEKIVWMATAAQQTATLTLNPPNMGPLQIVVNVSNEQATASFFSAQPEVRQALEAAFPRLKEMMNEAGIQLGQATVSADTPRQDAPPHRQGQAIASPFHGTDDPAATALQTGQMPVQQSGRGLIDTFA